MYQHTMKILNFATEKTNLESKSNTYEKIILDYRSVIYCTVLICTGQLGARMALKLWRSHDAGFLLELV